MMRCNIPSCFGLAKGDLKLIQDWTDGPMLNQSEHLHLSCWDCMVWDVSEVQDASELVRCFPHVRHATDCWIRLSHRLKWFPQIVMFPWTSRMESIFPCGATILNDNDDRNNQNNIWIVLTWMNLWISLMAGKAGKNNDLLNKVLWPDGHALSIFLVFFGGKEYAKNHWGVRIHMRLLKFLIVCPACWIDICTWLLLPLRVERCWWQTWMESINNRILWFSCVRDFY